MLGNLTKRFSEFVMAITARRVRRDAGRLAEFGFKTSASTQLRRMRDIRLLLWRHRPRHIVELGAGFSTLIFADWCRKEGAKLTSIEQNESWARHVAATIGATDNIAILVREARIDGRTRTYVWEMPSDADFVYVDGPGNAGRDTIKRACGDMVRAFDSEIFPRVIVVERRTPTIDLLLSHPASTRYDWYFATEYAEIHPGLRRRGGRHTVAVLRDERPVGA
jgi:hypothetical protein